MNNNLEYPMGSDWRKWDLQVQTILDDDYISIKNYWEKLKEDFPENCKLLVQKIGSENNIKKYDSRTYFFTDSTDDEKIKSENYSKLFLNFLDIFNKEVGAVCITDHNYKHNILLDILVKESKKYNIKIIPGVEINIQGVHALIVWEKIFYNKSSFSESIKSFLSKINIDNKKENGHLTVCNKGYIEVISKIDETNGILIYPHCNSDNGLFQERGKTDRTQLADQFNHKEFNILQAKNKKSVVATDTYIKQKSQDLNSEYVFTLGTDTRSLKDILHPDEEGNYCWIKSNPTFKGLKQIIYEPQERCKIEKDNPSFKYDKPYFSKIEINDEIEIFDDTDDQVFFVKKNILLNKNLVAIVGGRGSGKSLLINYLANVFVNKYSKKEDQDSFTKSQNFKIEYFKNNKPQNSESIIFEGNKENTLDFLFIPQDKLKDISNKKTIKKEIENLLKLDDLSFNNDINEKINKISDDLENFKKWFIKQDENGNYLNDKIDIQKIKKDNESLLENIITEGNREKLKKYTANIESISNINNIIKNIELFEKELNEYQDTINYNITNLNSKLNKKDPLIKDVDFERQLEDIKKILIIYDNKKKKEEIENLKIREEFEKIGYSGDLSALLNNAETYKTNIKLSEDRLKEILEMEKDLSDQIDERSKIGNLLEMEYKRQKKLIDDAWKNISKNIENPDHKKLIKKILDDKNIKIVGKIKFDKKIFYNKLEDVLNLNFFKDDKKKGGKQKLDKIRELIDIRDLKSFINFILNDYSEYKEGDGSKFFIKDIDKLFFNLQERNDYLYVYPEITHNNRPLEKLSAGQRGTIYLCIKLATDAFSKPIIIDQPEDDLDNEFISDELIDIFKEIKKYRQVIIVTHNANLVVNSDAEQVIIANNENEKLHYIFGSLEDNKIIEGVCKVLEGGREAFNNRKKRYNLNGKVF